ncbi:hypothetical protein ID866_7057 [Astraeus odoratus]|nr:hypothetical protein ID866_7057 [Astraeus odoratus]
MVNVPAAASICSNYVAFIRICTVDMISSQLAVVIFGISIVYALSIRQAITALSTSQIDYYNPYTYYASAAFCSPDKTLTWSCGTNCQANSDFKPVASGGDGAIIQYWYVGYDPNLSTVIVAHQGTDPFLILPVIEDVTILLLPLNPILFPGISSDILVHAGFQAAQAGAASDVLAAVQNAMKEFGATSVTIVGHSLGAAIALLDSVYLPLHLPPNTTFQTITYGLPRVGNKPFADYVDANLHLTHINNKEDPIPTLPPQAFLYVHPEGEIHIEDSNAWVSCPGQDNPSTQCIVGASNIFTWDAADHNGPYNGIEIECSS